MNTNTNTNTGTHAEVAYQEENDKMIGLAFMSGFEGRVYAVGHIVCKAFDQWQIVSNQIPEMTFESVDKAMGFVQGWCGATAKNVERKVSNIKE